MKKGIIYKVSSPSGKVYVGQTKCSLKKRKREHLQKAFISESTMYRTKFAQAVRKYENLLKEK